MIHDAAALQQQQLSRHTAIFFEFSKQQTILNKIFNFHIHNSHLQQKQSTYHTRFKFKACCSYVVQENHRFTKIFSCPFHILVN